jgi:RNA polymerase sigma-70 factor (ECF subfamily)
MRRVFVSIATRHLSKKKLAFSDIHDESIQIIDEQPGVIEKISEDEIHQLIRQLPIGYRTVFNMHVIEGYSHEEIATLLKIEAVTSRSQLLKARKMLQTLICKRCNPVML